MLKVDPSTEPTYRKNYPEYLTNARMNVALSMLDRSVVSNIVLTSIREEINLNKLNFGLDEIAIIKLNSVEDVVGLEAWIDEYWSVAKNQNLKEIFFKKVEGNSDNINKNFNSKDAVLRDYFDKECIKILVALEPKLEVSSDRKGISQ